MISSKNCYQLPVLRRRKLTEQRIITKGKFYNFSEFLLKIKVPQKSGTINIL